MKYSKEWYQNNKSYCRACGICKHWHEHEWQGGSLATGDCDKIPEGQEWGDVDTKTVYKYDGYSFEDEIYDEVFGCFEGIELEVEK